MPVEINWPAIGLTLLPNVGGAAGVILTRNAINSWCESLKTPASKCKVHKCGLVAVRSAVYGSVGYASYLVLKEGGGLEGAAKVPLIVYGSNILLNWAWTPIFFGSKRADLALYELQLVNVTAIATTYLFYKINPVAAYLMLPYGLWLGLTNFVNFKSWKDSRKDSSKVTEIKED